MDKEHICEEIKQESLRNEDTEISITFVGDEYWSLYLYDGDGISTRIKHCPYCGETLS